MKGAKRILIIGSPGSGKSTLSRKMAGITGLSLIHLDREFWHGNWQETPKEEWRGKVEALVARDEWIMDGNYHSTLDLRLPRAQKVIFLRLPKLQCFAHVVWRSIRKGFRPDLPETCKERVDFEFWSYVWNFDRKIMYGTLEYLDGFPKEDLIILKSHRAKREFLRSLK